MENIVIVYIVSLEYTCGVSYIYIKHMRIQVRLFVVPGQP